MVKTKVAFDVHLHRETRSPLASAVCLSRKASNQGRCHEAIFRTGSGITCGHFYRRCSDSTFWITTLNALLASTFVALGRKVTLISEVNGRISELRGKGYVIDTSLAEDRYSFKYHRLVARACSEADGIARVDCETRTH
jgi:hypothetical protein